MIFRTLAALAAVLFAVQPVLASQGDITNPDNSHSPTVVIQNGLGDKNDAAHPLFTSAAGGLYLAPVAPAAATATKSALIGCIYNSGGVTFATGQQGAAQCDSAGRLIIDVGTSALPTGAATAANQATVNTNIGAPGATACATDTGSCSLNALAQRIAQRTSSLIALFPAVLGQTTKTASLSTALASDQVGTAGSPSTTVLSVQGVASGTPVIANQTQINGVATAVNNGATSSGTQRVTISNDSTGVVGVNAGENFIGQTGTLAFDLVSTPATTNGAYSAGDVIGGAMTFTVARASGKAVTINEVQVTFKAAVQPNLRVVLFTSAPTVMADNAAYSLTGADALLVRASLSLAGYTSHGTPKSVRASNLGITYVPSGTDVILYVVDDSGITLTSTSDMQVRVAGYRH